MSFVTSPCLINCKVPVVYHRALPLRDTPLRSSMQDENVELHLGPGPGASKGWISTKKLFAADIRPLDAGLSIPGSKQLHLFIFITPAVQECCPRYLFDMFSFNLAICPVLNLDPNLLSFTSERPDF